MPFEVPNSWCWVRLGNIAEKIGSGSTPRGGKSVYQASGVVFIRSQNVYNEGLYLEDVAYITDAIDEQMSGTKVQPNDILLNITGASIGRSTIVPADFGKANVNQHVSIIRLRERQLQPFVHKVLISDYIQSIIKNVQVGAAQEGLPAEKQKYMLIPIPPLAEQRRIITAIETAFAAIDEIELNKTDLQAAIAAAKNKILSLAIRGKLVPQDPNDEPASVLLKRIRAEREELIKAGKIKRDKNDSVIVKSDDNSYYARSLFEVPAGWLWTQIGQLAETCKNALADGPFGSNLKTEHYTEKPEVRIIQLSNIGEDGWRNSNEKYTTYKHAETISRSLVCPGEIVIAKMMPAGRAVEVPAINDCYVLSSDAIKFVPSHHIDKKFILYAINSSIVNDQILAEVQGIGRVRTSLGKLRSYFVPLPPLPEQQRIVRAIDSAFEQLDSIISTVS